AVRCHGRSRPNLRDVLPRRAVVEVPRLPSVADRARRRRRGFLRGELWGQALPLEWPRVPDRALGLAGTRPLDAREGAVIVDALVVLGLNAEPDDALVGLQ